MKTLLLDNSGRLYNYADSAMGRDVMPLFVPDGDWHARIALAYRIGRLGKNVSHKFALRYFDAVAPVVLLCPGLVTEPAPIDSWHLIMDSAVTTGRVLPFEGEALALNINDGEPIIIESHQPAIDALVKVTQLATVKTGDLIIPPQEMSSVGLERNMRITASINDTPLLAVKIK